MSIKIEKLKKELTITMYLITKLLICSDPKYTKCISFNVGHQKPLSYENLTIKGRKVKVPKKEWNLYENYMMKLSMHKSPKTTMCKI